MGVVIGFICIVFIIVGIVNFTYYKIKEKKYYKTKGIIVDIEVVKYDRFSRKGKGENAIY